MKIGKTFFIIPDNQLSEGGFSSLLGYAREYNQIKNGSYNDYCKIQIDDSTELIDDIIAMMINESTANFDEEAVYLKIAEYISTHLRLSYATVSRDVFRLVNNHKEGAILTNLQSVVDFAKSLEPLQNMDESEWNTFNSFLKVVLDVIVKFSDHVNLALIQFDKLRESEVEYDQRFLDHMAKYEQHYAQDSNSRMMTMLSIFTALSFLLFGGISSLDNIFAAQNPFFKTVCLGCVWGLGMINMIFVFLFCIAQMTDMKGISFFKDRISDNYNIVLICNYVLFVIFALSGWFYYVSSRGFYDVFQQWLGNKCWSMPVLSLLLIIILIGLGFVIFHIKKGCKKK